MRRALVTADFVGGGIHSLFELFDLRLQLSDLFLLLKHFAAHLFDRFILIRVKHL